MVAFGPPISSSRTRNNSWLALIVGGSVALIAGGALVLGGGLAYREQQMAVTYFGGIAGAAGLVLISIGVGVRLRRKLD